MNGVRIFFIVGLIVMTWLGGTSEVLFSPDDHPTNRLLQLINQAQTRIHAAVYMLTDKTITDALIAAKNRGVDVQMILDSSSVDGLSGKGNMLKQHNMNLYVYDNGSRRSGKRFFYASIMHNKFALIDNHVWTGSFNWTKSANNKNQENVVITDDQIIYKKYEQHFDVIKTRCTHYGPMPAVVPVTLPKTGFRYYLACAKEKVANFFRYIKNDIEKVTRRA